jgi:hypothetical protein
MAKLAMFAQPVVATYRALMQRLAVAVLLSVVLANCAEGPPTMKPLEFLTRDACVQTKIMRSHLDDAIQNVSASLVYNLVDLDTLPATDVRKAYPTPTVLYGGVDLFGMAEPKPPYPEPT